MNAEAKNLTKPKWVGEKKDERIIAFIKTTF